MVRVGALFAGYGGLEMGVQSVLGGDLAWYSEIDKGALKILHHHYPDVPNVGDITTADWSQVAPVDILTGGSPCQDLSHAGKRAGMTEGTRSNLWVSMREAIAQLRPSLVVWENVRGAYSACADSDLGRCPRCVDESYTGGHAPLLRALGRVLGDLADLGYDAAWYGLRAADVGAPHGRFRVFVVAYPQGDAGRVGHGDGGAIGYPDGEGRSGFGWQHTVRRDADGCRGADRPRQTTESAPLLPTPATSDTNGAGQHGDGGLDLRTAVALLPTPAVNDMGAAYTPDQWDAWTGRMKAEHGNGNGHGKSLSIEAQRLLPTPSAQLAQGSQTHRSGGRTDELLLDGIAAANQWGDYADAIARWEHTIGRPAPNPTMTSAKGNPQLAPAFVEWLMGLPHGWVTDTPHITRNEALKALGNGVVPQQAEAALRLLLPVLEGVA